MTIFPTNNLPTASLNWGREVEKSINNLESGFRTAEVNNVSRDAQLQASYKRLDTAVTQLAVTNAAVDQAQSDAITALQTAQTAQNTAITANTNAITANTTAITANTTATDANTKAIEALQALGSLDEATSTYKINAANVTVGKMSADRISAGTIDGLSITGGSLNTTPSDGKSVSISGSSASFQNNGSAVGSIQADGAGRLGLFANSGVYITGGSSGVGVFQGNFSCEYDIIANGGVRIGGVGGSLFSRNEDGQMEGPGFRATGNINVTGDLFVSMDSGSGTTVVVDGNNKFLKSSSSQRHKQQVEEMPLEAQILSMPLKTFKYNYDVETYGEEAPKLYGYIAEELDAQGLTDFVIYETLEDGSKRPDAVRYDSIFAALHRTVQHQASVIEALEARLAALEDRVQ